MFKFDLAIPGRGGGRQGRGRRDKVERKRAGDRREEAARRDGGRGGGRQRQGLRTEGPPVHGEDEDQDK